METRKNMKKKVFVIAGLIILVPLLFGSSLLLKKSKINIDSLIMLLIMSGFVIITMMCCCKKISRSILAQLCLISFMVALFWNAALIAPFTYKQNQIVILVGAILFNLSFLVLFVLFIKKAKADGNIEQKIIAGIDIWPYIIIACFIMGSVGIIHAWLGAGAYDYYCFISKYAAWDFISLENFRLCGHDSQSYAFFMFLGQYVFGRTYIAARIVNILMAVITIMCFKTIIRTMCKNASRFQVNVTTAIFAFSPLLYGLVGEINTDFAVICFWTWLIYASVKKYRVLECMFAILLCFSKETGLCMYLLYMFTLVIYKFIKGKNKPIVERFIDSIVNRQVLLDAAAAYLYLVLLLFRDGKVWDGGVTGAEATNPFNVLGINKEYIYYRIHQMLSPNFLWVFVTFTVIAALIFVLRRVSRKKIPLSDYVENEEVFWTIGGGFSGYLILSLLYITWTNYRYNIAYLFFLVLFLTISLDILFKQNVIKNIILLVVFVLTFASNYYTLDRVSLPGNYSYDIGKDRLVSNMLFYADNGNMVLDEGCEQFGSIALQYNREYVYMGETLEKALTHIDYKQDSLLVFPNRRGEYVTFTTIFGRRVEDGNSPYTLFWNPDKEEITVNTGYVDYSNDETYEKLHVKIIYEEEELAALKDSKEYKHVYMLTFPFMEEEASAYTNQAIKESVVSHKLCQVNVYQFK